jgi:hypothetical protein
MPSVRNKTFDEIKLGDTTAILTALVALVLPEPAE